MPGIFINYISSVSTREHLIIHFNTEVTPLWLLKDDIVFVVESSNLVAQSLCFYVFNSIVFRIIVPKYYHRILDFITADHFNLTGNTRTTFASYKPCLNIAE